MSEFVIRTGPLSSLKSLHYHLAPQLKKLREAYLLGQTPDVCWDMNDVVGQRSISIAALTAFLSNAERLRDFVGKPIPIRMGWDSRVLSFLSDIDFIQLSKQLEIFVWQEEIFGGFERGVTNPNTKILYFDAMPYSQPQDIDELNILKINVKQKIASNFILRVGKVFDGLDQRLKWTVSNTTLELIANSLIHGLSSCFIGIQRTKPRITVCVCDTGIGFAKSLNKFNYLGAQLPLSNIQSLIVGSLIQKKEHGLRLAISEVLNYTDVLSDDNNHGWVIISSYNSEIRWQKKNWHRAKSFYDSKSRDQSMYVPNVDELLGPEKKFVRFGDDVFDGYWNNSNTALLGTRIAFEILIKNR